MQLPIEAPATAPRTAGMPVAQARLLAWREQAFVALPVRHCVELVDAPEWHAVPGAAPWCHGLLAWRGRRLPFVDLEELVLAERRDTGLQPPSHALVVSFRPAGAGDWQHGALATSQLPQAVQVGDDAACELPRDSERWPWIARSCFRWGDAVVPVLDTAAVFGTSW